MEEDGDFPLAEGAAQTAGDHPWWLREDPLPKPPFSWPKDRNGNPIPSVSFFHKLKECELKHWFRYEKKCDDPASLPGFVGRIIHGALEDAGRRRLSNDCRRRGLPPTASPEELVHLAEYQEDTVKEGGQDALDQSREILSRMDPVYFGDLWAVEHRWTYQVTPELRVGGIADVIRLRYDADPKSPSEVLIEDYKTGRQQVPSKGKLEQDPQAVLTLSWAKREWPGARIRFRLWNVTLEATGKKKNPYRNQTYEAWTEWTPHGHESAMAFVRACWNVWRRKGKPPPNVGGHCAHCFAKTYCWAYKKRLRRPDRLDPGVDLATMSIEDLIHLNRRAKILEDMASERRKDTAARILELMGDRTKSYRAGDLVATKMTKRQKSYRSVGDLLSGIAEIGGLELPRLLDSLAGISDEKLTAFMNTLGENSRDAAEGLVEEQRSLSQTRPYIQVREAEVLF